MSLKKKKNCNSTSRLTVSFTLILFQPFYFASSILAPEAPGLELILTKLKVRVNIFSSSLFIVPHPAVSWRLILSGSCCRLSIVRSHDNLAAKVRRWMGFKGLQETWVQPPCLPVSPSLTEKTPSLSLCQSSVACRTQTFQPYLFT